MNTLLCTCFTNSSWMGVLSSFTSPRQLKITGIWGSANATPWKYSRRAFPAGAIRGVWKGPLTFRGRHRRAPFSLAMAAAFSTAAFSPPMTSWPGQL